MDDRGHVKHRAAQVTGDIVLGLGGTVDYEIEWDSAAVERAVLEYGIVDADIDLSIAISSERDLICSLLAFAKAGTGGERFVSSSDIVEEFAARFEKRITLGGTCVRAALAMDKLGISSIVHLVSVNDVVRRLLPARTSYLSSATEDSTHPHLIVQFPGLVRIRAGDIDIEVVEPNRVMFANDPSNRELLLAHDLGTALTRAGVFLVSGFNVIQEQGVLGDRMDELEAKVERMPEGSIVFYEDAGFHLPALSTGVRDRMAGLVDVFSLNEDEMQGYLGRPVELLDVPQMVRALGELQSLIPARTLVLHTRHWSLALGRDASEYEQCLRGGITMASARYCHGDDFTEADYDRMHVHEPSRRGRVFAAALVEVLGDEVCCVPAFVLTCERPTTVGLGDTFVGGFIAALAVRPAQGQTEDSSRQDVPTTSGE